VTPASSVEIDEIAFCFGCVTKKRKSANMTVYVTYKSGRASKHLLLMDTSKNGIPLALLKSLIGAMLPLLNWLTDIYMQRNKLDDKTLGAIDDINIDIERKRKRERESQSHEKR